MFRGICFLGDGFVAFATEDDLERGIRKDREHLGSRYIEVRRSTRAKMKEAMSRAKEQFRIVYAFAFVVLVYMALV